MSEYKPGTVARVTWHGVPYTAIKGHPALWWGPGMGLGLVPTEKLTDIRPLVVLDPEDYEQVRGLVQLSSYLEPEAMVRPLTEALQRGLRSLVKPPRIPEPGRYGVVEAGRNGSGIRLIWVRLTDPALPTIGWRSSSGSWSGWSDLIDPVLIRPGIDD